MTTTTWNDLQTRQPFLIVVCKRREEIITEIPVCYVMKKHPVYDDFWNSTWPWPTKVKVDSIMFEYTNKHFQILFAIFFTKFVPHVYTNKVSFLPFLAHLAFRPCELLSSLFVCRPSVNISHFNLLLRNHWANCIQTLVEWSLDDPLSKLCPVIPTSNQDGCQAKNRKKGGWNFNCPLLL